MRYSEMLGKTTKQTPKDEESRNAQLLIKAGFIQKEMAGVYAFLPLGNRVLKKIENIIREEMNSIGGQEVWLGALQNPEVWKRTDRWDDEKVDIWFKTKLHNETELGLATTHEEPLTKIMTQYVKSHKDLPLYVYQFQTKFRNELRAKSGLLRTREFLMKDLYSFSKTERDFKAYYEKARKAYRKIFDRLGIGDKTFFTLSSGGTFSKYSHEFQSVCENGEDTIYLDERKKLAVNNEVYTDEVLSELGLKKSELKKVSAIEVGNIFPLGTKFSDALGLTYTNESGEQIPVVMGSYGIGLPRALASIVELNNDENGIMWPESVAPYMVHLVGLNLEEKEVEKKARQVYQKLSDGGVEVLFDDRKDVSAGEKFADADLIGIPYQAVVSKNTKTKVEVRKRSETDSKEMSVEALIKLLL